MKWLVMLGTILAIVIVAIVRRMMMEKQSPPPPPVWDSRERMPFESFYEQFYKDSGLSEAVVFKLLEFVSLSSGVEYKLIRPEDSLESFPRGSLKKHVLEFAEIMVKATRTAQITNQGQYFDPNIQTVDDFIRKLGPLAMRVEEHHRQLHQTQ
ncbi:MAG: hypothetical protein ROO76_23375 [Terriglobia bacterium]|nr:hypothetical protein [Terriglobia bacterium]